MAHTVDRATCREMLARLNAYIDGELEAQLCAELEAHLAACGDCRVVVNTLRRTIELYRALGESSQELPGEVAERLYARLNLEGYL